MKQNELKQILKPLIKKCVKEVIFEEGILSGIISEVIKGTNGVVLKEHNVYKNSTPPEKEDNFLQEQKQIKQKLKETKKRMLDGFGKDAYGGVDIFEGTTPAPAQRSPEHAAASPLGDVDPGDPGVDISGIMALGGKNWKALMG